MRTKSLIFNRFRIDQDAFSIFIRIWEVFHICFRFKDADSHIRFIEDLADLVPDRVVNALNVQFSGERSLHAVDDGKLCRTVFGDLEQALGLIEEARVLKRHAHAVGQGLQEAHIRFAKGVFLKAREIDQSACLFTGYQWDK